MLTLGDRLLTSFRALGRIVADLLLTLSAWVAATLGGTLLLLWAAPFVGYIPSGDRPGVGWYGIPKGISWAGVGAHTNQVVGYGLYIVPFALWFAFFAYLLVRLSESCGVGRWWVRPLAGAAGILAAGLTILSVAWILALGPVVFWTTVVLGGIFGYRCLPRSSKPGPVRAPLLNPLMTLESIQGGSPLPLKMWTGMAAIAVFGSLFYGASMAQQLDWRAGGAGLWMALSAGLGWCVLGLTLKAITRQPFHLLVQTCLITMAYGEGVLFIGAALNLFVRMTHPGWVNAGVIGTSNVVMALALASQLRALGVPHWKVLTCWMLALNGSGALFFLLFRHLL